uniref:Fibronectin type-III domain-containing protein n=1 Tax=Desulfatirhabdium butyrativorans TaxID=340467 RepID=A0A7C4RRE9_9BACT
MFGIFFIAVCCMTPFQVDGAVPSQHSATSKNAQLWNQISKKHEKIGNFERRAVAKRLKQKGLLPGVAGLSASPNVAAANATVPHYFGPYGNWAYSPLPKGPLATIEVVDGGSGYTSPTVTVQDVYGTGSGAQASATVVGGVITAINLTNVGSDYTAPIVVIEDATGQDAVAMATLDATQLTGGIRKFVDSLPGVGVANQSNIGLYIPTAVPDTTTYPGSDYYELEVREFSLKLHTDLPPTKLRGYIQVKNGVDITPPSYAGPMIIAQKNRPVRVKLINKLPAGAGGNLFIPVDKTVMGAGIGPLATAMGRADEECANNPSVCYSENRALIHLHGNNSAWISDGLPHQWITPANETNPYKRGVSAINVPDMPDPGPDSMTYYYTNSQGARLLWYHDHSFGLTRLNVYVGEASPYLINDDVEADMINGTNTTGVNPNNYKVLPDVGIPLIIQDKTFVDATTIAAQDPTWRWGSNPNGPTTGDLWYPHVYMPAQNPYDPSGMSPYGRWHYAPYFWPPVTDLLYPPVANPYYDPVNAPWEPPEMPATPDPSMPGEAFMDTPLVNGSPYPYVEVDPKTYRFRILNGANDRFFNLQLYLAVDAAGNPCTDPVTQKCTEVKMVPAVSTPGFPKDWPTDGREGGIPDPAMRGPDWIQIGNEGGFLPAPVVVKNQPITWNLNPTTFNFGNVDKHSLLIGTAERADVLVDFSQYAGKTLIVYNDAPAAFPALDTRNDYYTGNPDQTDSGGAPSTQAGYGPNIRTVMQIRVKSGSPAPAYDLNKLNAVFAKTASKSGVFEASQDPIIIPQPGYNSAYNSSFPSKIIKQFESNATFTTLEGQTVTLPLQSKAIQDEMGEAYDSEFGRMSGMLGLELPVAAPVGKGFLLYPFIAPPVDVYKTTVTGAPIGSLEDGTQIWRITHNGVDTHTIHLHLVNFQIINRVAWDGALIPIDPNEMGWKDTVRVNPLEHTIIAFRTAQPNVPFDVPNSVRLINPTRPAGEQLPGPPGGFQDPNANPITITNHEVNFGWENVYHCHLLAHEEMDMMHAVGVAVKPKPVMLSGNVSGVGNNKKVNLSWTPSLSASNFVVQKANDANFTQGLVNVDVGKALTYSLTIGSVTTPLYFRVYALNTVGDEATPGFPTITQASDYSNVYAPPIPTAPNPPSDVKAVAARTGVFDTVTLTWKDNSDNEQNFTIQMATNASFTSGLRSFTAAANATTYQIGNLLRNRSFYLRIRANNANGSSAWVNAAPFPIVTP